MCDYKKMYSVMFNAVTDAVEAFGTYIPDENLHRIIKNLTEAQKLCENMYIEQGEDNS